MATVRAGKVFCTVIFTSCSECCDLLELSQGNLTISLDLQPFAYALVVFCSAEVKKEPCF